MLLLRSSISALLHSDFECFHFTLSRMHIYLNRHYLLNCNEDGRAVELVSEPLLVARDGMLPSPYLAFLIIMLPASLIPTHISISLLWIT